MTNNIPLSQTVFAGINMNDTKAVADYIKSFSFDDLDHQSSFLQSLRYDLGYSIPAIAKVLAVPQKTWERFTFGKTAMKPINIRALIMLLYIRSTDKLLFDELIDV